MQNPWDWFSMDIAAEAPTEEGEEYGIDLRQEDFPTSSGDYFQ